MVRIMRALILSFLLALFTINSVADGNSLSPFVAQGWQWLRQNGTVDLYRKPVPSSPFPAFLAHTQLAAPARRIYQAVSDYGNFVNFIPSVAESRLLEQQGADARVYQRLAMPMLFRDRHYVIQTGSDLSRAGKGIIHIYWSLDRPYTQALDPAKAVTPDAFEGYWHLTELSDGSGTDAVYSIHVVPGGRIPAWLFSRAAERYVIDVIEAVRRQTVAAKK